MNKKPKIRFKGFTNDWEQCKLGDIIQESSAKSLDFEKNPLYSLTIQDGIIPKTERYERSFLIQKEESIFKIVKSGEFVTNPMNLRFGAFGYNKNAFSVSVSGYYDVFSIDKNKCSAFWNAYFKTANVLRTFDNVATGSLLEKQRVKFSTLQTLIFLAPTTMLEKQKTSVFFENLDKLITLHQRKCEKLKNIKKSLLEKMFPKNNEKIPAIRFKGFTNDWEQCKLGSISKRVQGNDGRMNLPTLTISAGNGWLDQRERFYSNIAGNEQKNYTLLSKGELSYNHGNSKLAKYGVVFELRSYDEALVPRVYHSFKVDNNNLAGFIEFLFATKIPDKELSKIISSGARMDGLLNINYEDFMNINITIPSKNEQLKINTIFRNLDKLITLHQRKLEKLQNIKKALLEKMFV